MRPLIPLTLCCSHGLRAFRDGRATGVEYVLDTKIFPDAEDTPRTVRAKKLVVLSAGTFGSPAILERSGIGARDVLERNGVTQIVDLPGVGENYSGVLRSAPFSNRTALTEFIWADHPLILMPFLGKDDADSLHPLAQSHPSEHESRFFLFDAA